jgi:hypothetical protein
LAVDKNGRSHFQTTLMVKGGKEPLKQKLGDTVVVNLQNATRARHSIHVILPGDQAAGNYDIDITVDDVIGKTSGTMEKPFRFTVVPRDFGLVQFQLYYRYTQEVQVPAPCVGAVGQTLFVTAVLSRGKEEKPWAADLEFRVLDEQGKALTAQPLVGEFKNLPTDLLYLDFRFDFPVQRAGNYQLQLKATDPINKRTTTLTVPFVAVEGK